MISVAFAGRFLRLVFVVVAGLHVGTSDRKTELNRYTNTWAVHIPEGDHETANIIAKRHGMVNLGQIGSLEGFYHFQHHSHPRRMRRELIGRTSRLSRESKVKWTEQQAVKRRVKRDNSVTFNDPLWEKQWYLNNNNAVYKGYDHNVLPVWKNLKITGRGVSVSILDDGIEKDHPDLKENYDPDASYDFNGYDADPSPRPTYNDENRHGTRCAGEVAAGGGNGLCGVGVAYGAKVGGIRMLDGDVTDAVEAHSLGYKPLHIDIYSSSWGPDDDGKTVDGPGPLAKRAFETGIEKGRDGLGNIFVWASGNGGRDFDNCNCDGYTNSIFTLSISSATEHGTIPWYSEFCASTLATTFSSGDRTQRKIVTTDLHHKCTEYHTGTSASAPLAAGILALALEANPKLTWRDMQHIVVRTSKSDKLKSSDWVRNGVGRKVSHSFGYGLLDAEALVETAMNWKTVPERHVCAESKDTSRREIPHSGSLNVEKETTACDGTPNSVRYLEHLEVILTLSFSRRGDLTIYVTSPQGTRSTLLRKRRNDYNSQDGFKDWVFMSTHTWEENPIGKWTVELANAGASANSGTLKSWQLRFHGTKDHPAAGYKNCSSECQGGCTGPSASDCVRCAHFKSNGICTKKCASIEYGDSVTKKCLPCHNMCLECVGPGPDRCKVCRPSRLLHLGKCVDSCPQGWFANEEKHCEKCDSKCLSCSGKAMFCTACKEDHQLVYNRCEINCKKNEYVENDQCRPCHPSCTTCNNGTAWSCTECGMTTMTRERVKQTLYLHRGMCVARCPSGFYGDKHQCLTCHASCKYCEGPLDKQCTSCKDGLVKVSNGTGLCLDNCPAGFSHGISEDTCVKCGSNCSACDPDQPSRCTACDGELYLGQQKCVDMDKCPRNTYPEPSSHKCEYCHPLCGTCLGIPTYCLSCSGFLYLHENKCIPACPTGTYGKDNKCLPCPANCSSCLGAGKNQCLKCHRGFHLFNNMCLNKCPLETFVVNKTGSCERCSITCDGCVGKATNCIKCKVGLKNVNGSCQSVCEDGTFLNGTVTLTLNSSSLQNKSENRCSKCHPSCVTCSGPSKYDCLRCAGVKFYDPTSNLCSLNCPDTRFYEDIKSTLCKPCLSECAQCSNETSCTKCIFGLVLHNTKCITHCPEGFYADKAIGACMKCDSWCKDCSESPSVCISCSSPRILFNNQCIEYCPPGMFLSKAFNSCLPCDDSCLTCVGPGPTHCTSCDKSMVLFQAQCRSLCPTHYYYSSNAEQCQPCDYYCKTCSGGNGLTRCTKCTAPFVLEKNMCVRTCSRGLVLDSKIGECVPCHPSCATCFGLTQYDCLSCTNHKAGLEGSVCKANCGVGKYRDPETSRCESCHPLCKTCSGSGIYHCEECVDGMTLSLSQCLSQCPEGQYREDGVCYTCSSSCKTCKGATKKDCLSCQGNYRLFNFTCVKRCPLGTYEEDSNGLMECQTCHPSCATCSGKKANECTSCRVDLYLERTSCVKQCSANNLLDENTKTCKICNIDCPGSANLSDRSVNSQNDQPDRFRSKRESHFILVAMATCTSLLAVFALFGFLRARSSLGYRRVDNDVVSSGELQAVNNVPNVYVRNENLEMESMLDNQDSAL